MIETVLGPVEASAWGRTCMHDHLLSDSSRLQRAGQDPSLDGLPVSVEHLGYLRTNLLSSADNLRLDDPALAVAELAPARGAGERALVECSSWGLGPDHRGFPEISRASGVAVVSAYGAYVPRTVPAWIAAMTEAELEAHLVEALTVAIPGTDFRAGMLGIMGTTGELDDRELVQLRAAARAAASVGAAVSVRLEPEARRGLEVLALLADEGLDAERVVFTNSDEFMDAAYWDELASAGAVLEMCFGTEAVHLGRIENPSDRDRVAFFTEFLAEHPRSRHVLGESVWTKMQLRAYGGYGYGHLLGAIVPELAARGVSEARIDGMLVAEPVRLLDLQRA